MLVVHVNVHVKPEYITAFRQTSVENARQSVQEPGIARFDVLQQADDPARPLCWSRFIEPRQTRPGTKKRPTIAPGPKR